MKGKTESIAHGGAVSSCWPGTDQSFGFVTRTSRNLVNQHPAFAVGLANGARPGVSPVCADAHLPVKLASSLTALRRGEALEWVLLPALVQEGTMILTILDPRTGEKVTAWFPKATPTTEPNGKVVAFPPAAALARARRVPFQPWPSSR